jgi:hypothetical protein
MVFRHRDRRGYLTSSLSKETVLREEGHKGVGKSHRASFFVARHAIHVFHARKGEMRAGAGIPRPRWWWSLEERRAGQLLMPTIAAVGTSAEGSTRVALRNALPAS